MSPEGIIYVSFFSHHWAYLSYRNFAHISYTDWMQKKVISTCKDSFVAVCTSYCYWLYHQRCCCYYWWWCGNGDGGGDADAWWRHQMETFSALLAICAGNSPVTGEFPTQRPMTRSFDVLLHLCLNTRFSNQSWGWWFETPSRSLLRHCNG